VSSFSQIRGEGRKLETSKRAETKLASRQHGYFLSVWVGVDHKAAEEQDKGRVERKDTTNSNRLRRRCAESVFISDLLENDTSSEIFDMGLAVPKQ
jgi:hypothetical protein